MRKQFGSYLLPLVGAGLLTAVTAALIGLYGGGFFKGMWIEFYFIGLKFKIGTPQLFDLGVMLVVIGMAITFLLNLSERGDDDAEELEPEPFAPVHPQAVAKEVELP